MTALENELEQLRRLQEDALAENAKLLSEQHALDAKHELVCEEKKALAERLAALEVAGSERSSCLTSPAPSLLAGRSTALADQLCELHSSTIMRLELDVERLKNELAAAREALEATSNWRGARSGSCGPSLVDKAVSCTTGPMDSLSADELASQLERWKRLYNSQLTEKRRFTLENEELVRQNRRLQSLRCKVNDYIGEVETQVTQLNSVIELFCCSPEKQLLLHSPADGDGSQPSAALAVPVLEASALEHSPATATAAATVRVSSFEALLAHHRHQQQQQHQHAASDSGLESSPEKRSDSSMGNNSPAANLLNSSLSSVNEREQQLPIGTPESGISDAPGSSSEKYTYAPYCPTCHSKLVLLKEKAISVIPDLINSTTSENACSTPTKAESPVTDAVTRARLALHSLQATLSADEPDDNAEPELLKPAPAFTAAHQQRQATTRGAHAKPAAASQQAPRALQRARAMKREHSAERNDSSPALETILSDSQESASGDSDSDSEGSATPTGELLIESPATGPGALAPDSDNPLERLEADRQTPVSSSNLSEFLELEVSALNEENIELKQRLELLQQALYRSETASRAASSSSSSSFMSELSAGPSSALAAPIHTVDVIVCASEATNKQTSSSQPPPVPPHAGPLSLSRSLNLFSATSTSTSTHLSKNGPATATAAAAAPARAGSAASTNSASLLRPPPVSLLVPVHPSPTPASPECSSTVTLQHLPAASQSQQAVRVAHSEAQTEAVQLAHASVQCSPCSPQHAAEQQQQQQQQVEALALAESRLKEHERELDRHARLLVLRDDRIGQLEEGCSQLEASHERDLFELKQYKVQ